MRIGDREVGRVGLGTNRLENTDEGRAFLNASVEAGLNHIDTAHLYTSGESERTIGAALAPFGDELTVATKGGFNDASPDKIRAELDQSLQSLNSDAIDLYYLHRVGSDVPIEESVGALAELRDQGKIRNIGISEVSIGEIDRAKQVTHIAAVQNEFSLAERMHDEVIDYCAVEGIAFVPFFPLRGGGSAVDEIASAHGATANQVKVAWLLARSDAMAPIPGTLSVEHLQENLAARDIVLSPDDVERLDNG